jgi:hypothetical protein
MKTRLIGLFLVVYFLVPSLCCAETLSGENEPVGHCGCPIANPYDLTNNFGSTNDNPYEIINPDILFKNVGSLSDEKLANGFANLKTINAQAPDWFKHIREKIENEDILYLEEKLIPDDDINNARKAIELAESFTKSLLEKNLGSDYNKILADYMNNISKLRDIYTKTAKTYPQFTLDDKQKHYSKLQEKTKDILDKMFP